MADTERAVMEIMRRHVDKEVAAALEEPGTELAQLGLDSLELVAFLVDLEQNLSVQFPADLMAPETFRTPRSVADAVEALRAAT
jgi:acyl carrier protein